MAFDNTVDKIRESAETAYDRNSRTPGRRIDPAVYRDPNRPEGQQIGYETGNTSTRGKALIDPGSSTYEEFEYGGKRGLANEEINRFRGMAGQAQGRPGVQVNQANTDFARHLGVAARGMEMASREGQRDALGMYRDMATGQAPSLAQLQFAQALQAQQREQASLAASARGGGLARAAAQRAAAQNSASMGQNSAGMAAALRLQEQQQALAGYSGLANAMRGQDQGTRGQDLGQMGEDAKIAGLQAGFDDAQKARNDAYQLGLENMGMGVRGMQQAGTLARQNAIMQGQATEAGISSNAMSNATQASIANDARTDRYVTAGVSAGAAMLPLLLSDEQAKKDIRPADGKVSSFLEALRATDYRYKDPDTPVTSPGRHASVMAQDLEKSELGRRMVHDTPEGKVVDYKEGFATMLASMAALNDRVGELEGLKKALASRASRKAA